LSYKILFFRGEPIFLNDEQGKKLGQAWLDKISAVEVNGSLIATSGISAILKIDEEPNYPKLDMPKRSKAPTRNLKPISEALQETWEMLKSKDCFKGFSSYREWEIKKGIIKEIPIKTN